MMQMFQMNMNHLKLGLLAIFLHFGSPVAAQDGIALELRGAIDPIDLSLDELDAMTQITLETSTIWTDGLNRFSGVSLKALLDAQSADGTILEMIALNDYTVTMPIADLQADAPIVATRMNEEAMSIRDKGPFWVIFPYDSGVQFQSEIVYSRSIWQLKRLVVLAD
jgi:hypothetical protein